MAYERLVPGTAEWDLYFANHQSRYQFALQELKYLNSEKVLDAATGVGYGANFLKLNGIKEIVAIDRSNEALEIANKKFAINGLKFLSDDCEKFINCAKEFPFDAIVSFETLEHLPQPSKFIENCFNGLSNGGTLIISTPNQLVSSPEGIKDWEFHEKEYSPQELIKLLREAGFIDIVLFGQQYTPIGILRQDMRAELNRLNSNPMVKVGKWIQKVFRGRKFSSALPEKLVDFEIEKYADVERIERKGLNGPFVLIAVCKKP